MHLTCLRKFCDAHKNSEIQLIKKNFCMLPTFMWLAWPPICFWYPLTLLSTLQLKLTGQRASYVRLNISTSLYTCICDAVTNNSDCFKVKTVYFFRKVMVAGHFSRITGQATTGICILTRAGSQTQIARRVK